MLIVAGMLEAGWLVGIQKSQSFTYLPAVVLAIVAMILSLVLFSYATKTIPAGQAYLVWLAIGAVTITVINHYCFNQLITVKHLLCFALIFSGIIGLKTL